MTGLEWMDRAECARVGAPAEWFFPDLSAGGRIPKGGRPDPYKNGRAVCAACPVTVECAAYDLTVNGTSNPTGLWGGLTPDERRTARARTRRELAR